jgi:hypothetical protein
MTEGKKRQIRRVASQLGHPVKRLKRTHIGKLGLGALRPGEWMELTEQDIQMMVTSADEFRRKPPEKASPSRSRPWRRGPKSQPRSRKQSTRKGKKPRR